MAEEAKSKGNAAFSSGDYATAITHFTEAINLSPTNHILYSNRSASYASLHRYEEALSDAKKTIELKPDWSKGYSRLGAAFIGLSKFDEAVDSYKKGLEIDPSNEMLISGLADASRSRVSSKSNPFVDAFQGKEMWEKLTADPGTRVYLEQDDFVKTMKEIQRNPNNLNLYMKDKRVMKALGVLLNVKFGGSSGEDTEMKEADERKEPEPEMEPMELTEEERQKKERKEKALKEKGEGNVAYKKKDFGRAVEHYTKAMELDDEDISYLTNRAAVYLEMGKVLSLILGLKVKPLGTLRLRRRSWVLEVAYLFSIACH